MRIARTGAGMVFLVAIATVATIGGRRHEARAEDEADPLPWSVAVAAVGDLETDVAARRQAAAALESLALEESYGAEVRSTPQVRALRDELAALAGVVGRSGD